MSAVTEQLYSISSVGPDIVRPVQLLPLEEAPFRSLHGCQLGHARYQVTPNRPRDYLKPMLVTAVCSTTFLFARSSSPWFKQNWKTSVEMSVRFTKKRKAWKLDGPLTSVNTDGRLNTLGDLQDIVDNFRKEVATFRKDVNLILEDITVEKAAGQERADRILRRLSRLETKDLQPPVVLDLRREHHRASSGGVSPDKDYEKGESDGDRGEKRDASRHKRGWSQGKKRGKKSKRKKKSDLSSESSSDNWNGDENDSDEVTSDEESVVLIDENGLPRGKPSRARRSKERSHRSSFQTSSLTSGRTIMTHIWLREEPGTEWWGPGELQPTKQLYRRLRSYCTYLFKRTSQSMTSSETGKARNKAKGILEKIKRRTFFSGNDPIQVLSLLALMVGQ